MTRKRSTPLDDGAVEPAHCSAELRARILRNVPYFRALPAEAVDAVNRRFRALGYPAGATIYHEGEPSEGLFVVAHGKIKLLRHGHSGDAIVFDIRAQGDLFGGLAVLGQPRYAESAAAQTACCVLVIARDDFRHLLQSYPDVALNVVDGLARDLAAAHDSIEAISTMPVETRVALVLLRLADRLGEPDDSGILIQSPLSQQDLAAMVSTTAETVSRVISGLRRAGQVETGRRWIRIRDRAALARLAEGDSRPH